MRSTGFIIKLFILFATMVLQGADASANVTEIRCRVNDVQEVYLVWGINDWQPYPKQMANTIVAGMIMRTLMTREGDEYVARLEVDSGNVIDYGFMIIKRKGPFNARAEYWDMGNQDGRKGYYIKAEDRHVVRVSIDVEKIAPKDAVSLTNYGKYLFLFFTLGSLFLFLQRKYYHKKPAALFSQAGYFFSLTGALVLLFFFIRIYIAGLLLPFLFEPLQAVWQMFGAIWDDLKYTAILFLFFGLLFLWLKKIRKAVLAAYAVVVFLSVIAALANIRVMSLLGRPFNYQWLYYSGFLQSRDASLAFAANVNWQFIAGILLMVITVAMATWLLYQLYTRKNLPVILLFPLFFLLSLLAQVRSTVPVVKTANPVLFFVKSAYGADAAPAIDKTFAGKSDFDKKNTDSLPAAYAALFRQQQIKNVVFVVLESTPWEYVGPYSKTIKATPFLDAYRHKAVFENIYAHIPATNKSMFSFLCAAYPEISFKSLTLENPGIPLPSIPSELKKYGYRSAFFNSGDNGYQNAGGFLKAREFDVVEDFHQNNCSKAVFSDERYSEKKLDGVEDSCLSVRLFNWLDKEKDAPFFAMMWTFQTHYPYFVSGKETDYKTGDPSLEKYLNALHRADEAIRDIVEGLERRGLLESTLVVVSGDHGEAFGRHDQTTHAAAAYEENLHVPFLLINPLLFNDERIATTGGISDIGPTIFSILHKPAPGLWQGENLFSVNRRKRVYFFNPYSGYLFGMREGNLKLIYNATDNTCQVFDLAKDPQETNNIAADNSAFIQQGREKIRAWMYYQHQYMSKMQGPVAAVK